MAMLAGPKRKQKFSLNPRGKSWSDDKNKFGQKLMEKMGWSTGKGLGANLDGMTENIRVKYKNDSVGMGFNEHDKGWLETSDNYSNFLATLSPILPNGNGDVKSDNQTNTDQPEKFKSLEELAKNHKTKILYSKMIRGKDLSRATEKDLAGIFGKKKSSADKKKEEEAEKEKETGKGEFNNADGLLRNAGSMVDYFRKKIPTFKNKASNNDTDSDAECPRMGFGFGSSNGFTGPHNDKENDFEMSRNYGFVAENPVSNDKDVSAGIDYNQLEVKRKKKQKSEKMVNLTFCEGTNEDNNTFEVKRKKKEKKKNETTAMENPSFNGESDESRNNNEFEVKRNKNEKLKEVEACESFCEDIRDKKKKKKKHKKGEEMAVDNPTFTEELNDSKDNNEFEVQRKKNSKDMPGSQSFSEEISNEFEVKRKKKKKKSQSEEVANETFHEHDTINNEVEVKRKKKKQSEELAVDNPTFTDDADDSRNNIEFEVIRKKKKRKSEEMAMDNPTFTEETDESRNNNEFEVTRKKKKRKSEEMAVDNPTFAEETDESRNNNEFEVTRKKKKRKSEEMAVDNPTFTEETDESRNNNEFEVTRKKKKRKSEEIAVDNPTFTEEADESRNNNEFEVTRKNKKRKSEEMAMDNPTFTEDVSDSRNNNEFEVTRKKKKRKSEKMAMDNPTFSEEVEDSMDNNVLEVPRKKRKHEEVKPVDDVACNLVLNVTCSTPAPVTPILVKTATSTRKRKSVRFSEINEERIIPSLEHLQNRKELFEINSQVIDDGLKDRVESMSCKIDRLQAQVENDINETKSRGIGETGNPISQNEILPNGKIKLKFRNTKFGKVPFWLKKEKDTAKASYKHLIVGDIVVDFKGSNIHEFGYAVNNNGNVETRKS